MKKYSTKSKIRAINDNDGLLMPHNQVVYKKIINAYKTRNKVLIQQATGTGKSFVAMKLIKDFAYRNGKKVLFVTCANPTKDDFTESSRVHIGYNPADKSKIDLTISTYAGLKSKKTNRYDLIIFDEVHHVGAKTWGRDAKILLDHNPKARVLGMTATIERSDKVDIREVIFEGEKIVSKITLVEAIQMGILPAPDYVLTQLYFEEQEEYVNKTISQLKEKLVYAKGPQKKEIEDYINQLGEAQQLIANSKQLPEIFKQELNTPKLKKGKFIVFCPQNSYNVVDDNNDDNAENKLEMEKMMEKSLTWFSEILGGKQPNVYGVHSLYNNKHNKEQIRAFENDDSDTIKLLFSVNMLNEGKHIKDIDGVIMLRPTSSMIVFLQQLGRALSVGGGTTPKVFDLVSNLNYGDFEKIQKVAEISNHKSDKKKNIDLDTDLNFKLTTINLETIKFLEKFKERFKTFNDLYMVDNLKFDFFKFYSICQECVETTGSLKNANEFVSKINPSYNLAEKLYNVKKGYRQKINGKEVKSIKLTDEQYELMFKLEKDWYVKDVFDFDKFYKYCLVYHKEFGDLKIDADYKIDNDENYNLAQNMYLVKKGYRQLQNGKENKAIRLDREQYNLLFDLDKGWVEHSGKFNFDEFYLYCLEYFWEFGNLDITKANTKGWDYPLQEKMRLIKKEKKYQNGKGILLTEEQYQKLYDLDENWDKIKEKKAEKNQGKEM